MKFYTLASGSRGNCSVIMSNGHALVIDCGYTKRNLTRKFKEIGLCLNDVDALLLTHSHSDHISQIKMFQNCAVYASFEIADLTVNRLNPFESFRIGPFLIEPLPLSHDAELTLGYIINDGQEKLVYITDTGYVRQDYYPRIADADYYIMESNHDVEMLMNTQRPYPIKRRIISDNGHLDNEACAEVLANVVGTRTKEIILAHISEQANTPQLALDVTVRRLNKEDILIRAADQHETIEGGQL